MTVYATVEEVLLGACVIFAIIFFLAWNGAKYAKADVGVEQWRRRRRMSIVAGAATAPIIIGIYYSVLTLNFSLIEPAVILGIVAAILILLITIRFLGGIGGTIEQM